MLPQPLRDGEGGLAVRAPPTVLAFSVLLKRLERAKSPAALRTLVQIQIRRIRRKSGDRIVPTISCWGSTASENLFVSRPMLSGVIHDIFPTNCIEFASAHRADKPTVRGCETESKPSKIDGRVRVLFALQRPLFDAGATNW